MRGGTLRVAVTHRSLLRGGGIASRIFVLGMKVHLVKERLLSLRRHVLRAMKERDKTASTTHGRACSYCMYVAQLDRCTVDFCSTNSVEAYYRCML